MRAVGDFKKAGLVFVEGDLCKDCNDGGVYGREGDKSEWVKRVNNGLALFNSDTITEFAWRTNKGVKPDFSGLVEFTYNGEGCEMQEVRSANNINWAIVIKWRPHLPAAIQTETPEEKEAFEAMNKSPYDVGAHVSDARKPVYTQAMCDAGELPPVGGYAEIAESTEFLSIRYEAGAKVKVYATFTDDRGVKLAAFVDDGGKIGGVAVAKCFKPIKTELGKAIDEMVATAVNSSDDIAKSVIHEACVKLANAGYTKEKK